MLFEENLHLGICRKMRHKNLGGDQKQKASPSFIEAI
jgi:hypothetical protein